jgi:hypothetical protein
MVRGAADRRRLTPTAEPVNQKPSRTSMIAAAGSRKKQFKAMQLLSALEISVLNRFMDRSLRSG